MLSKNNSWPGFVQRLPWNAIGRWWAAGLSFFFVGLGVLYLFMDVLRMPLLFGTLLGAEVTTIVRYAINDRWVFRQRRTSWTRFWQFHVANAGGFVLWWVVTNVLARMGVYYLIASTAGTACSVLFSLTTNFLWIWRKQQQRVPAPRAEVAHGG